MVTDLNTSSTPRYYSSPPVPLQVLACAYAISLPLDELTQITDRSIPALVGFLLVCCVAFDLLSRHAVFGKPQWQVFNAGGRRVIWIAFAFVTYAALTLAWSINSASSISRELTFVSLFASVICMAYAVPRRTSIFAFCVFISTLLLALLTIASLLTETSRIFGDAFNLNLNDLAGELAFGLAFALVLLRETTGPRRMFLVLGSVLILIACLVTGSRTGGLAVLVVLALGLWTVSRNLLIRVGGLLAVVLIGVSTYSTLTSSASISRSLAPISGIDFLNSSGRDLIWESILVNREEWQFQGVGVGAGPTFTEQILFLPKVAHNAFLGVWLETGVLGLVLFASLIVVGLWTAKFSPYRRYLYVSAPVVFTFMLTLSWEYSKILWLCFALAIVAPSVNIPTSSPSKALNSGAEMSKYLERTR